MKQERAASGRQAARLLRWYPKQWRSRYGAEFLELLDAEIREHPWSWRRNFDVARHGLGARLTSAGLTRHATELDAPAGARLASAGCALATFLAFGASMWAQLAIGWRWSEPDTRATYSAMFLMSIAIVLFFALLVMGAVPVAWRVVKTFAHGNSRFLLGPLSLLLVGASVLVTGSRHFENGWPGTGGHLWSAQGLVPGGVAAFAWASTLWISSYWAHPQVLVHSCRRGRLDGPQSDRDGLCSRRRGEDDPSFRAASPDPALRDAAGTCGLSRDARAARRVGCLDRRRRSRTARPVSHWWDRYRRTRGDERLPRSRLPRRA